MDLPKEKDSKLKKIFYFLKKYGYLIICFISLFQLDIILRYAYSDYGITFLFDKIPMLFTFAWCFILTAVAWILPGVAKRIYLIFIMLSYSAFALTHCIMARVFNKFFSFSAINFIGDGASFFDTEYLIIRKIVIASVLFGICAMIFAAVIVPRETYGKIRVITSLSMFVFGILLVFSTKILWLGEKSTISYNNYERNSALYENFTDTRRCLMLTGLYQYSFRDFCMSSGLYNFFDTLTNADKIEELDTYYNSRIIGGENDKTGIFEGKNIIMIQLEAIDTWMITEDFMPELYKIKQSSIDFINHWAPMYIDAGTFNTENIVNTGIVSPFSGYSTNIFIRNAYPYSFANLLRGKGYTAKSFHRSIGEVYNREDIHKNWGYGEYHDGYDMGMKYLNYDSEMLSAYDKMVSDSEKFLSFIITYSAHGPYANSDVAAARKEKTQAMLPAGTDEMIALALSGAYETDVFIGGLFDRLKSDGRLDDTVLIFYSDHYDYYVLNNNLIMEQKNVFDLNLIQSTPFFIYSSDTAPEKVTKVTSSTDILPTIANMFGLREGLKYYFGDDAFSECGGYVIFGDYSWYDGDVYWNSASDYADSEFIVNRNAEIKKRFDISWETMFANYFGAETDRGRGQ